MKFDNPKYVERYEDVIFELETPLNTTPNNGVAQKRNDLRFTVDNTGEVTTFNWNRARLSVGFKVTLLTGVNITKVDHNGTVNGSHSLIERLEVKINGKQLYDCNAANHCVNIKNMLEDAPAYVESLATNEYFYVDTNRHAQEDKTNANYNKGFADRKKLLGTSSVVNTEIPLNRYSFFESLEDELLPNTKVELHVKIEDDGNVIWQAGANCRVVITRMQLIVPRVTFNSEGQELYMSTYLKPHKWTYLRENIGRSNSSTQRAGNFRISNGISKPRHVSVFIINDASISNQTANPFPYNAFSVSTDPQTLVKCHLEVGNGNKYPDVEYTPEADLTRVYRDVMSYAHKVSEFQFGSLLNVTNYKQLFPFIYFDLTHQKQDIRDGVTTLMFKYELSGTTATPYSIYAITLYEQEVELYQSDKKILIRS